eukprot:jgi/Tetstr1/447236/TSEL_034673.t1
MFGAAEAAMRGRDAREFEDRLNAIRFPDLLVFDAGVRNEFHRRIIAPLVHLHYHPQYHAHRQNEHGGGQETAAGFAPDALRVLAAYIVCICERCLGDKFRAELWASSRFRVHQNAFHPHTYVRERPLPL